MSSEQNPHPNVPLPCANGCGFYGSPTTRNLCSKCYGDAIRREQAESHIPQPPLTSSLLTTFSTAPNQRCGQSPPPPPPCSPSPSPPMTGSYSNSYSPNPRINLTLNPNSQVTSMDQISCPTVSPNSDEFALSSPAATTEDSTIPCDAPSIVLSGIPHDGNSPDTAAAASSNLLHNTGVESGLQPPPIPVSSDSEPSAPETSTKAEQINKSRCWKCDRKVGLMGFQCRCGHYFCGPHRYADAHNCGFDYKSFERQHLRRANQKIVAEKVAKI